MVSRVPEVHEMLRVLKPRVFDAPAEAKLPQLPKVPTAP